MKNVTFTETLPSKAEIFRYWKDKIHLHSNWIDWGEPSCWACGWGWNGRYDIKDSKASLEIIERCWESAPLQRCHIVPKHLQGSGTVENLFLMCRECHDLAPNTPIREIFFQWTKCQSWFKRNELILKAEMEVWGIHEDLYPKFTEDLHSDDFKLWTKNRVGLHWPQSGYSGFGKRLTPSTMLGLWWFWNKSKRESEDFESAASTNSLPPDHRRA